MERTRPYLTAWNVPRHVCNVGGCTLYPCSCGPGTVSKHRAALVTILEKMPRSPGLVFSFSRRALPRFVPSAMPWLTHGLLRWASGQSARWIVTASKASSSRDTEMTGTTCPKSGYSRQRLALYLVASSRVDWPDVLLAWLASVAGGTTVPVPSGPITRPSAVGD